MTPLATLNQRLADSLGRVACAQARYQWRPTAECFYYFRPPTSIAVERYCWAERLGRGYVLCRWSLPEVYDGRTQQSRVLTESQWKEMFQGSMPYPARGEYKALPETFAREVTPELNANYVWAIDKQQSQSFEDQLDRINLEHALARAKWREEFEDASMDMAPAFGQAKSGSRDGHVSFPSVGQR